MKREKSVTRWLSAAFAVLVLASMSASAAQRHLSDFTSRQGAWCAAITDEGEINCAASFYGGPDCPDGYFSFTFAQFWNDGPTGFVAGIDLLGDLDEGDFGTTDDGTVLETRLPGGRADVQVIVHARNALTRVFKSDADGNPIPLFGYFFGEVAEGAPPTLGEALYTLNFTNTAPGAPLPDLNQMAYCPAPGQAEKLYSITAHANGPIREAFGLPEGTPGRLDVTEIVVIHKDGTASFPVEHLTIRPTKK